MDIMMNHPILAMVAIECLLFASITTLLFYIKDGEASWEGFLMMLAVIPLFPIVVVFEIWESIFGNEGWNLISGKRMQREFEERYPMANYW